MSVKVTRTTTETLTLTETDLREVLVEWAKKEHGLDVAPHNISIKVSASGGSDGYGNYDPVKGKFEGVTITSTKVE